MSQRTPIESLDSLLDMMANLLGVLIVVLAVTVLNLPSAVDGILDRERPVAPAPRDAVEHSEAVATGLEGRRDELARRWLDREGEVEVARAALEGYRASRTELGSRTESADAAGFSIDELLASLQGLREEKERLEDELADRSRQCGLLVEALDWTPPPAPPMDTIVTVPDPRLPREGTQPMVFLCRAGRIVWLDLEPMERGLVRSIRDLEAQQARGPEDYARVAEQLTSLDLGDEHFRWSIEDVRRLREGGEVLRSIVATLQWRNGECGESVEELQDVSSRFQRVLREHDPEHFYGKFLVWPDGFAVYQHARALVTRARFDAGWIVMAARQEHRVVLASEVEVPERDPLNDQRLVRHRLIFPVMGGFRRGHGGSRPGAAGAGASLGGGGGGGLGGGGGDIVD